MMRSRLTCKPPMRFDSVSWKPSEMAMPPMPSAVMAALTSTRKQVDSMMHTPVIHTAPRAMLMKMELEGKSRSSLMASTRPRKRLVRRATTARDRQNDHRRDGRGHPVGAHDSVDVVLKLFHAVILPCRPYRRQGKETAPHHDGGFTGKSS